MWANKKLAAAPSVCLLSFRRHGQPLGDSLVGKHTHRRRRRRFHRRNVPGDSLRFVCNEFQILLFSFSSGIIKRSNAKTLRRYRWQQRKRNHKAREHLLVDEIIE